MAVRNLLILVLMLATGCAQTYHGAYHYEPRPSAVVFATDPASEAQPVHVLVTFIGLRTHRADPHPATAEFLIRMENHTAHPVRIDLPTMELRSADMKAFDPPVIHTPEPPEAPVNPAAAPGESTQFTVYFPLPEGRVPGGRDLDGLTLRLPVIIGEQQILRLLTFSRRDQPGYYRGDRRFYDPAWPHFGIYYHRHF